MSGREGIESAMIFRLRFPSHAFDVERQTGELPSLRGTVTVELRTPCLRTLGKCSDKFPLFSVYTCGSEYELANAMSGEMICELNSGINFLRKTFRDSLRILKLIREVNFPAFLSGSCHNSSLYTYIVRLNFEPTSQRACRSIVTKLLSTLMINCSIVMA